MGNERCKWEKKIGEIFCGKGKDNWGERMKKIVRRGKFCVRRIKIFLKKGINAFVVPIFWGHFYFGPYFSILPILVPKMKKCVPIWSLSLSH